MAATRGTTTCMLSNYEELVKTLDNIAGVDAEKVIKKCTSDAKSRAQAWVSAAVCEVYAIKKADVKAALCCFLIYPKHAPSCLLGKIYAAVLFALIYANAAS